MAGRLKKSSSDDNGGSKSDALDMVFVHSLLESFEAFEGGISGNVSSSEKIMYDSFLGGAFMRGFETVVVEVLLVDLLMRFLDLVFAGCGSGLLDKRSIT